MAPSTSRTGRSFVERETNMDKERPGIMAFAGLGMTNALCLGIGMLVGWPIDNALGT